MACKSPHEMEGAMIKSYYAEKTGIDPKDIAVISVMPCTAKKFEAKRPELARAVPQRSGGRGRGHHDPRAGPDD